MSETRIRKSDDQTKIAKLLAEIFSKISARIQIGLSNAMSQNMAEPLSLQNEIRMISGTLSPIKLNWTKTTSQKQSPPPNDSALNSFFVDTNSNFNNTLQNHAESDHARDFTRGQQSHGLHSRLDSAVVFTPDGPQISNRNSLNSKMMISTLKSLHHVTHQFESQKTSGTPERTRCNCHLTRISLLVCVLIPR